MYPYDEAVSLISSKLRSSCVTDVARATGLTQQTLCNIKYLRSCRPHVSTLLNLANYYHIPLILPLSSFKNSQGAYYA